MKLFFVYLFFIFASSCYHSSTKTNRIELFSFSPINAPFLLMSDLKDSKALVIVMRERDCPISEKYGPRLAHLEEHYSKKNVKFIFVYVGQVRPEKNAKKDLEKFKFKSPYIIDKKQSLIKALGAETTGDVFILNPAFQTVYRGPLDDQFHLLKSAIKAKNHYVKDVLEKLLSGEKVIPQELPAPGCIISKPLKKKVYFRDISQMSQ